VCSAGPVRVYLVPLPVWVAVQYGSSVFLGSVLACFARLKWGGGGRDSTGRLKWRGCAAISFSFSLVSCHYSWRADMRGRDIALFLLWYYVVFSCVFFIFKLLIVDNLLQEVSEDFVL
jgi:hypothetical protein